MINFYKVKIIQTKDLTYNTKKFVIKKPENFKFISGQACNLSINIKNREVDSRPFSIASINEDLNLEFIIKIYQNINGFTSKIALLKKDDELLLSPPFGAIAFKGPGLFIAGGTGITPFLSILRELRINGQLSENSLIYSNRTEKDIILKPELEQMSNEGLNIQFLLTREKNENYLYGRIDRNFLVNNVKNKNQYFYVCGPTFFTGEITYLLINIGINPDFIIVDT